jgi:hypothetical protein
MENIIIGLMNIFKMKKAEGELLPGETQKLKQFSINGKIIQDVGKKFLIPFFIFHYGIFTLVHGIFVVIMFGFPNQSFSYILATFALLFLSHYISYRINYIGKREYMNISVGKLFYYPYNRVIIMHITILIGGMLVQSLGSPIYALIVMIIAKIILDLKYHNKEHKGLVLVKAR